MVLKLLIGVVAFAVILRVGIFMLRMLGSPVPEPDEGEMRRVSLKYRCTICGMEVKMTKASVDLPEPPRHCMEDMQFVAPIE
jgi:hypothetical protein